MKSEDAYKLINLITDTLPVMEDINETIYLIFEDWLAYEALGKTNAEKEKLDGRTSLVEVVGITEKYITVRHSGVGTGTAKIPTAHAIPYEFLTDSKEMFYRKAKALNT